MIGAGTGGLRPTVVERLMRETLDTADYDGELRLVRYHPPKAS
ncbi:MAG TPA: hypothetical protein VD867_08060 [Burkholderiales bacterium]|nr:hypothetical protein [Burkholderiales bacterium]